MTTTVEIPMTTDPGTFSISLAGTEYQITVLWRDAVDGGWTIDIADASGTAIINGIPLVTGADLLEQYPHLGLPGALTVSPDAAAPTYDNLGSGSHLYFTASD